MKKLLSILILLLLSAPAWGADWYVRPSSGEYGDEDGTSYAAAFDGWSDIVWGVGGVVAGDTLWVCGEITIADYGFIGASGSSGSPILIRGDYPGDAGTITGHALTASGKSYITIQNLTVESSADGTGHIVLWGSSNITISGCTVTRGETDNHGIFANHATNITISGNTLSGFSGDYKGAIYFGYDTAANTGIAVSSNIVSDSYYGVYLGTSTSSSITSNTLTGKTGSKIGSGIVVICGSSVNTSSITVTDNSASAFSRGLEITGSTDGTCTTSGVTVLRGSYNSNSESGIEITGKVATTTITGPGTTNINGGGTHGTGVEIYSSSGANRPDGIIIDNWTASSNTDATGTDDGIGLRFDNNSVNCIARRLFAENNFGAGVEFNASTSNIVEQSILANNNSNENVSSGNVFFNGNASSNTVRHVTMIGGTTGVFETDSDSTGNAVTNSIIAAATTGFKGTSSDLAATYNVVNATTGYNGVTKGAGAVDGDPILNAAYGIAGNSPAKDAGAVLYTYASHPGDRYGRKIYGDGPDIGAVERVKLVEDGPFGVMPKKCRATNAACYAQ